MYKLIPYKEENATKVDISLKYPEFNSVYTWKKLENVPKQSFNLNCLVVN